MALARKQGRSSAARAFLLSIVLADEDTATRYREVLLPLTHFLEGNFQFWEVVIAISETDERKAQEFRSSLQGIENIRILRVNGTATFYRRRLAGTAEAIGDVVLISTLDELPTLDISGIVDSSYSGGRIHVPTYNDERTSTFISTLIGSATGYRVNHASLTIGLPRERLETILARPDAEILLRFEPTSGVIEFERYPVLQKLPSKRSWRDSKRRFILLGAMITGASPGILRLTAIVAFSVATIAILYGFYAVAAYLLLPDVAPGWLTTSLLQALTATLLGVSISGLSMGLVRVIELLSPSEKYAISSEESTLNLTDRIESINVEFAQQDDKSEYT